jgi:outer membrane lipopolysaccharide assembly protein LptE/RlpB
MKSMLSSNSSAYPVNVKMMAAVCAACVLTACGGGGGSTPLQSTTASRSTESVAPAGSNSAVPSSVTAAASTMVVARGPVSALGTLVVNGVRYDDRTAAIRINGRERLLEDLKLGMVVEVEAERNNATQASVARSVSSSSFAEGRVDAIDLVARTISVMGITIAVPATTVFEGWTGLQDPLFKIGQLVDVHGLANGPTGAVATRIERKTAAAIGAEDLALTGVLSRLDTVQKTFVLSGTIVAYSNARIENVGAGLADGMTVRVEGIPSGPGVITASEINGTQRAAVTVEGYQVEETGYVSDFVAPFGFKVNGMRVDASGAVVTGTLANNVRVEVRGVMRNGVLLASRVERDDASNGRAGGEESKFEGIVTAVSVSSFQVNGFTVVWDANTRFDHIAPGAIRSGTRLEIQAVWTGTEYVATRIKGED